MADQDTPSAFLAALRGGGAKAQPTVPKPPEKIVSQQAPKAVEKRSAPQAVLQAAKQVVQKITGRQAAPQTATRVLQIDSDILEYFEQDSKNATAAIHAVLRDHIKMQG